jgi:tRNA(fMet)-specific endonuclease VapC
MTHLIDSDIVIDYLFGQPDTVATIADLRRTGLSISVISYKEVLEGLADGRPPRRARQGLRSFLRGTRTLVISRRNAERASTLRTELRRQKRQVNERALDLLIAATAIDHGLILVTRNNRDYEDIPELELYSRAPYDSASRPAR